jgi:alpha-tubulin suppressor-like RCC1 family protein
VQVGALTAWSKVRGGESFTVAIKTDGTLWSWGNNTSGKLGLGNTTYYSSPKQVGALTNWATVAPMGNSVLAVKTDGTLWSWGQGDYGKLGLGNTTSYNSPKQIGALTTWSTVSGGNFHALAVKTNGTLWSWGANFAGSCGLGNTTAYSSPVQVGALTAWSKVSGGNAYASFAIKTDGTMWAWGQGSTGRLGLGNTTDYSSPKQIGALTTWSKIVGSGYKFGLAIKTDGTLWSWGSGGSGQLGLGNLTSYSSPKQVGALTTWSVTSGGSFFSLGIYT